MQIGLGRSWNAQGQIFMDFLTPPNQHLKINASFRLSRGTKEISFFQASFGPLGLYVLFKKKGATRVATNLPPFHTKNIRCIFWTAYGKCTCKSKIIQSIIYPLDTFRYDTLSLSMTISHLQIAVFLNSHPGSAFGRPVVMAGLRPAMTTGGLEKCSMTPKACWLKFFYFATHT